MIFGILESPTFKKIAFVGSFVFYDDMMIIIYDRMRVMTYCQDHILTENIWFVWSENHIVEKVDMSLCGTDKRMNKQII